jgi:hypothetical protein
MYAFFFMILRNSVNELQIRYPQIIQCSYYSLEPTVYHPMAPIRYNQTGPDPMTFSPWQIRYPQIIQCSYYSLEPTVYHPMAPI